MALLHLRRAGKSVLLLHHSNRSGGQRGTSRKEDVLDSVLGLRRPHDYSAAQGARFEVHFEKSRGFYGPDAEPFESHLLGNGQWHDCPISVPDDGTAELRAMKANGLSVRQIAQQTGMPRSTVHRRVS